jgi:pantoate--beta-alanine ligase
MLIARTLPELRSACARLREGGRPLALVPTMGALHAGHAALVRAAADAGAAVIASIFVNPLQFNASEDLARYPRDEAGDLAILAANGCEGVWMPSVEAMYPPGGATTVDLEGPALRWEGAFRPGHFRGVATVVSKLFGQVRPDAAYFGEKDWQQLQVVTRMTADLHLTPVIVGVPTVREADGLALSSRNRFLTAEERRIAPRLHAALAGISARLAAGEPAAPLIAEAEAGLAADGFAVEYLALVDGPSLAPLDAPAPGARLIAAARLGSVRLIDNIAA